MRLKIFTSLLALVLLLNCASTATPAATPDLPNIDEFWDYSDPLITELRFIEILADIDL